MISDLFPQKPPSLIVLPVQRKLAVCALFYLAGIRLAPAVSLPPIPAALAGALLAGLLVYLRRTRHSALVCCALLLLLTGNVRMGLVLAASDEPTGTGARIEGRVREQITERRFVLDAVTADGAPLRRPVRVTLMAEDEEDGRQMPLPGMTVSGTGRLFAQRGARNPGGRDERLTALADGYELSGYLIPGWEASGSPAFSLKGWFATLQSALCRRIDALFGGESPLFCALLAGDRTRMDADTVTAMRRTGIVHILTVSGMHIGLLGFALSALLRRLRLPTLIKTALLLSFTGFYALLTGFSPGTARALIMLALRETAGLVHRRYDRLTALSAAALLLTAVRPALAFSLSFVFSFMTVLGITLTAPRLQEIIGRLPLLKKWRRISAAVSFCIAAQLAAVPMQLQLYGYVPLTALPVNLVTSVLLPVLLCGGFACLLLSLVSMEASMGLGGALSALGGFLETAAARIAERTAVLCRLPAPGRAGILILMAVFALGGGLLCFGCRRRGTLAALLAVLGICYALRFDPRTRYVQLDVGQGDGALLRHGRRAVLSDLGPASSFDMLNYLRWEGLFVDGVILSHLDEDHAGALLRLLNSEIRVGCIYTAESDAGGTESETVRLAWQRALELGVPIRQVLAGDTFEAAGFGFSVLSPEKEAAGDNERSLVLLSEVNGTRLLLTGDLPSASEPEGMPDVDVLKVAHHGSRHSTSYGFLAETMPEIALISVGEGNSYGHPTERVLRDLSAFGADVYRTDRAGCVTVWLDDGGRRRVSTWLHTGAEEWTGEDLK